MTGERGDGRDGRPSLWAVLLFIVSMTFTASMAWLAFN